MLGIEPYLNGGNKHGYEGAAYPRGMVKRTKKKRGEDWIRDQATLAGRITTRMEELGLSPTDLAHHCGVSVTAVGWWLRGETKNLKLQYLFALADRLGLEARWLGIKEGPKAIGAALDEIRSTLDRVQHSGGGKSEYSPPSSETIRTSEQATSRTPHKVRDKRSSEK